LLLDETAEVRGERTGADTRARAEQQDRATLEARDRGQGRRGRALPQRARDDGFGLVEVRVEVDEIAHARAQCGEHAGRRRAVADRDEDHARREPAEFAREIGGRLRVRFREIEQYEAALAAAR